jgi:hypothetical protein
MQLMQCCLVSTVIVLVIEFPAHPLAVGVIV